MSFKLIARDNKINIYDAYADKYHVVENDEELSKLIDENGKLLPDEQLRQYFATKESKSRKIQKGFTTKKANLKKEYGDVEKQIFKDVVKYKIYSKYGNALSNDDINAFNKNPTAETIKKFKSLRSEIRDEAADTFKEYEKQYQQDYNDKNNLASILSAYQQMNKDTPLSQVMMTSVILQMMKSDINSAKTGNEEAKKQAINKLKENAVALPLVPAEVKNEIKNLDAENIDTKALEEAIDKAEKKIEVKQERDNATKHQFLGATHQYNTAKEEFTENNNLNGFDITPLHTLYKNLTFLNSSEENFNLLDNDKTKFDDKEPNKPTAIELDFGDDGEFKFQYNIDSNTPFYREITPVVKLLKDGNPSYEDFQKAYSEMIENINNIDSSDYTVTAKEPTNTYKFLNVYKEIQPKYSLKDNYDEEKAKVKNSKIMEQMKDPQFNATEFQTYIDAITDKEWFDKIDPTIEFNSKSESEHYIEFPDDKSLKPRNAFVHAMENTKKHFYKYPNIIEHLSTVTDALSENYIKKLKDDYGKYKEELKNDEFTFSDNPLFLDIENEKDIDKIPEILKATILHQKAINSNYIPKKLPTNDNLQLKRNEDYNNIMEAVSDDSYKTIYNDIHDDDGFKQLYNEISAEVDKNLNKGYYWYFDENTVNNGQKIHFSDKGVRRIPIKQNSTFKKDGYLKKDLDENPNINVISREIYNPYGYKYVTEEYFSKGMIRDMLALKLNKK